MVLNPKVRRERDSEIVSKYRSDHVTRAQKTGFNNAQANRLIANTLFEDQPRRLQIWKSPTGDIKTK